MLKGEDGVKAIGEGEEPPEVARVTMGEPAGELMAIAEGRLFLFA